MDNTFKRSVSLKLDKKSGLAHLSIRSSEYKVEIFKLNISDIGSILMQFSDAMRDQEDWEEIIIDPIVSEPSENNENN
jgi:hypothetical protein